MDTTAEVFGVNRQLNLDLDPKSHLPGSLNDAHIIRAVLTDAMRRCSKSRAQIAEEMSLLVGYKITERMLNGFTAESKEDYRFPAELDRAFCAVTGDTRLMSCRVEQAGLHVINEEEKMLMDLGRQFLIRNEADEQIQLLQRRLHGRGL